MREYGEERLVNLIHLIFTVADTIVYKVGMNFEARQKDLPYKRSKYKSKCLLLLDTIHLLVF